MQQLPCFKDCDGRWWNGKSEKAKVNQCLCFFFHTAHLAFCAAEILARAAADIMCLLLPWFPDRGCAKVVRACLAAVSCSSSLFLLSISVPNDRSTSFKVPLGFMLTPFTQVREVAHSSGVLCLTD